MKKLHDIIDISRHRDSGLGDLFSWQNRRLITA